MIIINTKQQAAALGIVFNTNRETPDGFVQTQYVPREFILSTNQDPTDVPDFHQVFQENGVDMVKVNYPAQPKDPLNQYDWRDKI
jgi:hypothetical protein